MNCVQKSFFFVVVIGFDFDDDNDLYHQKPQIYHHTNHI